MADPKAPERDPDGAYAVAIARMRRTFLTVGFFSAAVNILMLTGPMFMLQVYDRVLSSGSVATLQALFAVVVLLFIFMGLYMGLYDFLRTRLLSRASYKLDQDVGGQVYDLWVRQAPLDAPNTSRPLSDLAVVRGFLPSPAVLGLFDTPWIPFYLGIVFLVHPWLGWLAVAGLCVVLILALLNQWTTRDHHARAMRMDSAESFFADQSRRNAEAIVPLGMTGRITARWADMHRDGLAVGQTGGDRAEGFTASSKAFRLLLQSALLGLGGYLALQQEISPGMIVAASIIAGRALAPVDQVIGQWRDLRAREAHMNPLTTSHRARWARYLARARGAQTPACAVCRRAVRRSICQRPRGFCRSWVSRGSCRMPGAANVPPFWTTCRSGSIPAMRWASSARLPALNPPLRVFWSAR